MTEISFLSPNASKEKIKALGLVFEPNSFTCYYYADITGTELLGFSTAPDLKGIDFDNLKAYPALYSFDFSRYHTLVPSGMFKEQDAQSLLRFNTGYETGSIREDRILAYEASLISNVNESIDSEIKRRFPGLRIQHLLIPIMEMGHQHGRAGETLMIVHKDGDRVSITALSKDRLIISNSIDSNHDEDWKYFIHYAIKQLQLSPECRFILLGSEFDLNPLYSYLTKYFRHVYLGFSRSNNQFTERDNAAHWLGINAAKCAL